MMDVEAENLMNCETDTEGPSPAETAEHFANFDADKNESVAKLKNDVAHFRGGKAFTYLDLRLGMMRRRGRLSSPNLGMIAS